MYLEHFGLQAHPFENTPDPAFFFMGHTYREILAVMIHCVVSRKGLMVLAGAIGSGKTTLSRTVIRYLPERTKVISLLHPEGGAAEMLAYVASQLGIENVDKPHIFLVDEVQKRLTEIHHDGGRCVLIIDEAQFLTDELLEEIRLLTNMETPTAKLIQTILLGQPELTDKLGRPEMLPLRQRVAMFKTLEPMDEAQSLGYIAHRLKAAGGSEEIFTPKALRRVIQAAGGTPRVINQICDAALLEAFAADHDKVEAEDVIEAIGDVMGQDAPPGAPPVRLGAETAPPTGPARLTALQDAPAVNDGPEIEAGETQPGEPEQPEAIKTEPEESGPAAAPPAGKATAPKRRGGWMWPLILLCLALASLALSAWFYLANMPPPGSPGVPPSASAPGRAQTNPINPPGGG